MSRRAIGLSTVAGVFFAADLITFHYAVDVIGAGLGTVMGNLQVVIVAVAAWLLFGERPRAEVVVAIPIMLVGVVLISGIVGSGAYGRDPRLGVAIGLVTAAAYAGYLLIIRRASPDRRPAGPVAIATAVTGAGALLFGLAAGDIDLVPSLPSHAYLLALGVLSQSVGYLAIQSSLPRLPAVITSVLLLVQPVTTVVLGADPARGAAVAGAGGGRRAGDRRDRPGHRVAAPDPVRGRVRTERRGAPAAEHRPAPGAARAAARIPGPGPPDGQPAGPGSVAGRRAGPGTGASSGSSAAAAPHSWRARRPAPAGRRTAAAPRAGPRRRG